MIVLQIICDIMNTLKERTTAKKSFLSGIARKENIFFAGGLPLNTSMMIELLQMKSISPQQELDQ